MNGFREGRSPDVLAVADGTPVVTDVDGARTPWPAVAAATDPRVPIVFAGAGVTTGANVPDGTTLDGVAPTVSEALGFERTHPEVRSGTAVAGRRRRRAAASGSAGGLEGRRLIRARDRVRTTGRSSPRCSTTARGRSTVRPVRCRSTRRRRSRRSGPAVCRRSTGSPARSSGTVRAGSCRRTRPMLPVQIIATLADDLDHANPSTLVGLVAPDERDRGIVGGGWYPGEDPVDAVIGDSADRSARRGGDPVGRLRGRRRPRRPRGRARRLASARWIGGPARSWTEAERATSGSALVVVAGTGSSETDRTRSRTSELVDAVEEAVPGDAPAVAATVAGGAVPGPGRAPRGAGDGASRGRRAPVGYRAER